MGATLLSALLTVLSPVNLLMATCGTGLGIVIGALPGFTSTMGVALFIPVTFSMQITHPPLTAISYFLYFPD